MATSPSSSKSAPAKAKDGKIRHLYLIDGSGYLFRAYHALPPLSRPDGTPVNAVLGFSRMLMQLLDDPKVDHVAVILDAGRTTFRNDIYDKYKANRPEPPEDLIPQFPLIREAATAFGLPSVELAGFEADDLIATYARMAVEAGDTCTIVSSDKDLMQLIRPGVDMMDPMKQRKIGPAEVMEKFGVTPDKVVDVQALAGDSTDNVPGAPGIGVKTAAQLLNEYGDLETLLKRAGEIKQPKRRESLEQNAELIRISKKLVQLRDDVPPPAHPDSFAKHKPDPNVLLPWLEFQGFRSLIPKFQKELGEATNPVAPSATATPATPKPAAEAAPAKAKTAKVNKPFEQADYELIQDEKLLDEWIAEATRAGTVAFDCETDALDSNNAGLVGLSLAPRAIK
jgi:DNA polymerase-1